MSGQRSKLDGQFEPAVQRGGGVCRTPAHVRKVIPRWQAHTRKQSGSVKDVGARRIIPVQDDTSTHVSEEERASVPQCGETMQEIGKEVRRLWYYPGQGGPAPHAYYTVCLQKLRENMRRADAVRKGCCPYPCENAQGVPPVIPAALRRRRPSAHIMTQKIVMASPLYRRSRSGTAGPSKLLQAD